MFLITPITMIGVIKNMITKKELNYLKKNTHNKY